MTLRLDVSGEVFEGWIRARVERSLSNFAHRFTLTYLDRWASEQTPWRIVAGAECVLKWNSETLITGYTNRPTMEADGDSWTLTAAGRSLTGDLVESSATHETGHWRGKTSLAIVRDLCEPYGISVSATVVDTEPLKKFALREGETVLSAINRVCKIKALLPRTRTDGNVELYTSDAPDSNIYRMPVEKAIRRSYTDDDTMRHSEYLTRGIGISDQQDALSQGVAKDTGIKRYRPLVVVSDTPGNNATRVQQAIWEANVRYGRGEQVTYTIQGVTNPDGLSYAPGQRYLVQDDLFGIDLVMLCSSATLDVAESQLQTTVTLVRPEAYSRFAFDPKRLAKKSKRPRRTRRPNL